MGRAECPYGSVCLFSPSRHPGVGEKERTWRASLPSPEGSGWTRCPLEETFFSLCVSACQVVQCSWDGLLDVAELRAPWAGADWSLQDQPPEGHLWELS